MRPPRIAGFDYRGCHRYILTCCARSRREVFRDAAVVALGVDALVQASEVTGFDVWIYCFMPDHLHVLAEGRDDTSDFQAFVSSFRWRSAHVYRRLYRQELWQAGFWERVLRGRDATAVAARYIADNPVRAGLVIDPFAYPSTGSLKTGLVELLLDTDAAGDWRG